MEWQQAERLAAALLKETDFVTTDILKLIHRGMHEEDHDDETGATLESDAKTLTDKLSNLEESLAEALLTFFNDHAGDIDRFAKDPPGKKDLDAWTWGKPLMVDDGPVPYARTFQLDTF